MEPEDSPVAKPATQIFSFTEVEINSLSKKPRIGPVKLQPLSRPSTQSRLNQTYSVPPIFFQQQRSMTPKPKGNWKEFLSRNFSGDRPVRTASQQELEQMKTDLVSRLSQIQGELENDYKQSETMPDKLLQTAKKLEGSKYVQRGLLALSTGIIKKKKQFNRLYHDEQMRMAQLAVLTSGIEHLDKRTAQKNDLENIQKETNAKVETTLKSIEEEKMTEEKYLHMISTQKAKLKSLAIPIAEIKLQIEKASKELHDVTVKYQRDISKKLEYDRQAAVWHSRLESIKRQRAEGIKELIKSFQDKQQFLLFIRKEEEASRDLKNRRMEAQRLLALESSLKHLRESESFFQKVKKLENDFQHESSKFERIQQTTEVATANDMENYWRYMDANQRQLRAAADQLQDLLDERTRERDALKRELQELMQETEDRPIATFEAAQIENHFKTRIKELEENEQYLTRLQEVVMNATNCIARLCTVLDDPNKEEVTPENVKERMEFCEEKLTGMRSTIDKMQMASEEALNSRDISWSGAITRSDLGA